MSGVLAQQPNSSLVPRLLSAAVLIPLSLYVIYLGPPWSVGLGFLGALGIAFEWGRMIWRCPLPRFYKGMFALLGTVYISIATLWILLYLSLPQSWVLIFWLLFVVWGTDTGAYTSGRLLGGPKLLPSVSPNKTWAGFVGGMIVGTAVGWVLPNPGFSLAGIAALVLIAQAGDLLESQAKRWCQVKDSGALIPGHGGLLDRLDSLLAICFALALWQICG